MTVTATHTQNHSVSFRHLRLLWVVTVFLVLSSLVHSVYRTRQIHRVQLSATPDSLTITPPGSAIGHPEFQSIAVPLTYGPGLIEPQLGRLLISK